MANKAKKRGDSWRVQVYDYTDEQGKKHLKSFTAPTKAEAELLAAKFVTEKRTRTKFVGSETIGEIVDKYIRLVEPSLSPSTITVYKRARENAFPGLMETSVRKITPVMIQEAINEEIKRPNKKTGRPLSAKTIKNEWGLVGAALSEIAGIRISPRLPAYQVHPKELPEPEEVMIAVSGTDVELPVFLALWLGLRLSEIRGLKCSDVSSRAVTIRRVIVDTENGPVIKDTAKNETSLRTVAMAPHLWKLIKETDAYKTWSKTGEDGFIEPRGWAPIYKHFQSAMKKAGIRMSFHNLRALNASVMLALDVPDKYAMGRGGWKTPAVMKAHYQQTLKKKQKAVDNKINGYFENITRQITEEPVSVEK